MPLQDPEHAYRDFTIESGESFSQHHLKVRASDVSRYVLLPGSHVRGRQIAERLDDAHVVGATRGYYVYSGYYRGAFLTVCSTGMGGPAVAIATEELGNLGADTFVRVGSAGGIHPTVQVGDVVVATATARFAGASRWYLPIEFPAVADHQVTSALLAAAQRLGVNVRHGICASRDAFYVPWDPVLIDRLRKAGVLASEMEIDTLFIVGSARGWRCGAAVAVVSSTVAPAALAADAAEQGEQSLVTVCLEGMADLAISK